MAETQAISTKQDLKNNVGMEIRNLIKKTIFSF